MQVPRNSASSGDKEKIKEIKTPTLRRRLFTFKGTQRRVPLYRFVTYKTFLQSHSVTPFCWARRKNALLCWIIALLDVLEETMSRAFLNMMSSDNIHYTTHVVPRKVTQKSGVQRITTMFEREETAPVTRTARIPTPFSHDEKST